VCAVASSERDDGLSIAEGLKLPYASVIESSFSHKVTLLLTGLHSQAGVVKIIQI